MADEKTFWQVFRPQITPKSEVTLKAEAALTPESEVTPKPETAATSEATLKPEVTDSSNATLMPVAVALAEQILMLQIHILWAQRVGRGKDPWFWEVASDKTELVTELSNKYLDEGPDAMYDFIGGYSYRGKRPLSRYVACNVVNEALENMLASVADLRSEATMEKDSE